MVIVAAAVAFAAWKLYDRLVLNASRGQTESADETVTGDFPGFDGGDDTLFEDANVIIDSDEVYEDFSLPDEGIEPTQPDDDGADFEGVGF